MFTRNCPKCGKELSYKIKYVCDLAEKNDRRCYSCRVVNRRGKNVKCAWCGNPLYRGPSRLKKRKHHFCNNQCQALFTSKYESGKNSKLWNGGEEENRRKYRELVNKRRLENKQRGITILGGKCFVCKYDKCIDAIEFHHIDPKEKDTNVCIMLGKEWSEKMEREIMKCKLLCANCHREHHWNEKRIEA